MKKRESIEIEILEKGRDKLTAALEEARNKAGNRGPLRKFTFHCELLDNGTWTIFCPEWKYERPVKNLVRELAILSAEIVNTLEENEVTFKELK